MNHTEITEICDTVKTIGFLAFGALIAHIIYKLMTEKNR